MDSKIKMVIGQTYVVNLPPSWLFTGRYLGEEDGIIAFADAHYQESLTAPWPEAAKVGGSGKISKRSKIDGVFRVSSAAIMWFADAPGAAAEVGAIKGAA